MCRTQEIFGAINLSITVPCENEVKELLLEKLLGKSPRVTESNRQL